MAIESKVLRIGETIALLILQFVVIGAACLAISGFAGIDFE